MGRFFSVCDDQGRLLQMIACTYNWIQHFPSQELLATIEYPACTYLYVDVERQYCT
jgi:hypothetical protein